MVPTLGEVFIKIIYKKINISANSLYKLTMKTSAIKLMTTNKIEVIIYDGIIYRIPIKPIKFMRGSLKGMDTNNMREKKDREL
jgi:hypothetical protein